MIGYLEGLVLARLKDGVLLHTAGGVGYQIFLPTPLMAGLAQPGEHQAFYIVTVTRDSESSLYGFADLAAKHLFELLISVSGIGPKAGIAFLSAFTPPELTSAIVMQNIPLLATIPGIGKKTAGRLCVELSDRLGAYGSFSSGGSATRGDLLSALTNLGFLEKDVLTVLQKMPSDEQTFPEQLKQALALLRKN